MVQSCHSTLLDPPEFTEMEKNQYPLVICYNGRDHFTPTVTASMDTFFSWKLNRELGPILAVGLMVINELDMQYIKPEIVPHIRNVEQVLAQELMHISTTANAAHLRSVLQRNKEGAVNRMPALSQVHCPPLSGGSAESSLPSSSTGAVPPQSGSVADQPAQQQQSGQPDAAEGEEGEPPEPEPQPKTRKKHICHHCGKVCSKTNDLTGHLWKHHHEGEPIQCNRPPCKERDFSSKGALKKHVDTVHKKKFPYNCSDCSYGTRSYKYYVEHRIVKHDVHMVHKKTREPRHYICKDCDKKCRGPASLAKHVQRKMCTVQKRFQCSQCLKLYKTKDKRDEHLKNAHLPGGRKFTCETCGKELSSLGAHINHQLWHRGLTAVARARRMRERLLAAKRFKLAQKALKKRKVKPAQEPPKKKGRQVDPTKSAPAKLIGSRKSPRLASRKGKKGKK